MDDMTLEEYLDTLVPDESAYEYDGIVDNN
jgi:hypothetical protein